MGVKKFFYYTNCLFDDTEVVLGTLSASLKSSQTETKTSNQSARPASTGAGFSERQLHM
jgi:hypothetical protein